MFLAWIFMTSNIFKRFEVFQRSQKKKKLKTFRIFTIVISKKKKNYKCVA